MIFVWREALSAVFALEMRSIGVSIIVIIINKNKIRKSLLSSSADGVAASGQWK